MRDWQSAPSRVRMFREKLESVMSPVRNVLKEKKKLPKCGSLVKA